MSINTTSNALPFNSEEIITLLEAARMALGDADIFDGLAESLDISDQELSALRDRLNSYMGGAL